MLETFQDRLAPELHLADVNAIGEANKVLQKFLPRFNARFAAAAGRPEKAYRPVPVELSLTETISIEDTHKVARDDTVKDHWRVLQLLTGEVQLSRQQVLSMRAIARELGMSLVAARKYAQADSPFDEKLGEKERAKGEVVAALLFIERRRLTQGDIVTFHLRGQNR